MINTISKIWVANKWETHSIKYVIEQTYVALSSYHLSKSGWIASTINSNAVFNMGENKSMMQHLTTGENDNSQSFYNTCTLCATDPRHWLKLTARRVAGQTREGRERPGDVMFIERKWCERVAKFRGMEDINGNEWHRNENEIQWNIGHLRP